MTGPEAERAADLHREGLAAGWAGRPWSAREMLDFAAAPGAVVILETDGLLLGRVAGPEAEVATLCVRPAFRRAGLARLLLRRFHEDAAAAGAEEAFLEVAEPNLAARALYRSEGWEEVGRRRGYYRQPAGAAADALVLRRGLP